MRALLALLGLLLTLSLAWAVWKWQAAPPEIAAAIDLGQALSDTDGSFAKVASGRQFAFPTDHGEHPEFKTEWWYFTGNLRGPDDRVYGYQLTFFRSGLEQPEGSPSLSAWRPTDVFMAHFAVSDPTSGKFYPYERFSRRALGLSGVTASAGSLSVWLEDWKLERSTDGVWQLKAAETLPDGSPLALSLRLSESKPPTLQGDGGYSRKGPKPDQASYYISLTRLATRGELLLGQQKIAVEGLSWFDHEWSSSAMAPGLVGWDWFSLQLDDGWDLMLYLLRYEDGRLEPASSGTLVAPDGSKTALLLDDFKVEVKDVERSSRGVSYPSAWTITLPAQELSLRLTPRMTDQEMSSGVPYWEGAVGLEGERAGKTITGSGFVEMTGYK